MLGSVFLNNPFNLFLSLSNNSIVDIEENGWIYLPSNLFPFLSYNSTGFIGLSIFFNGAVIFLPNLS